MMRVTEEGVKDLMEIMDAPYTMELDFEQAEASNALEHTNLTKFVKAELHNTLFYIPFDPETMVVVDADK